MKLFPNMIYLLKLCLLILLSTSCQANIKNALTKKVKVLGNCEICKNQIEKSGFHKKVYITLWDKNTQTATITYDSLAIGLDEILKKIALAGYDNEMFLAPNDVYASLEDCCQYERMKNDHVAATMQYSKHQVVSEEKEKVIPAKDSFGLLLEEYFMIKDALVQSDAQRAASGAKTLLKAIQEIQTGNLNTEELDTWMRISPTLKEATESISKSGDISKQRDLFMELSNNMYKLAKISKLNNPLYWQHCPMFQNGKGADWLSKENTIKNPYYGSQMISCGSTTQKIE